MAFPHPKSGKDNYRNGDKPNNGRVIWKFFERTINVTDDRDAKDNVNPAKYRASGSILHDWFVNPHIGDWQVCRVDSNQKNAVSFTTKICWLADPVMAVVSPQKSDGSVTVAVKRSSKWCRYCRHRNPELTLVNQYKN